MRTLYHGSRVTVEQPEIRIQKFHKDFYWGFYCTEYETQAARWATRFGSGIVNVYQFEEQPGLSVKRFPEMSEDRKSTRLNSSHKTESRMPSSA